MRDGQIALAARKRTVFGKRVRSLRRKGWVPANIFGPGGPSMAIKVNRRELEHLLAHVPRSSVLSIRLDGEPDTTVLIREVDRKPTTGELYHVEFYRVSMGHALKTEVPLVFEGEAPAAKEFGAIILHAMDTLPVECLPSDLPSQIVVPLERLVAIDDSIKVGDLALPPGVRALVDADELVAKALPPSAPEAGAAAEDAAAEGESQ